MDSTTHEEPVLRLLKNINTIVAYILKFLGGLFVVSLITTIVNDYFASNAFVKGIADHSLEISFWVGILLLFINNFLDKKIAQFEGDEFFDVIKNIDSLSENLESIRTFLKETQTSIIDTRHQLNTMEKEKGLLEPVLETDRESVKNILLAQSNFQCSHLWKERILSFAIGIAASIVASLVYNQYL